MESIERIFNYVQLVAVGFAGLENSGYLLYSMGRLVVFIHQIKGILFGSKGHCLVFFLRLSAMYFNFC